MTPDLAPLQVLLTVDTELWPARADWPQRRLLQHRFDDEIATDLHGLTTAGGYGIPYQIGVLNEHGLRATYFVESLCAARVGMPVLHHITKLIQAGGHQVQLHLHTEWLAELDDPGLPAQPCQYLCQLPLDQQSALIHRGLHNLAQAGVPNVQAFRAGSYGGNLDTLRALARNGIHLDSSYNPSQLAGDWGTKRLHHAQRLEDVWEFPIAAIQDYPGHLRHAQLCAISHQEMRTALLQAWQQQWPTFVIVLHSFEMLRRGGHHGLPSPNRMALRRFDQLCALLDHNRDKFHTALFTELPLHALPERQEHAPLRSRVTHTLARSLEQVWSNIR